MDFDSSLVNLLLVIYLLNLFQAPRPFFHIKVTKH